MASEGLSSNWKKLQESLRQKEKTGVPDSQTDRPAVAANPLKRKATEGHPRHDRYSSHLASESAKEDTKSSQKSKTRRARIMGAYVSSLPTASYALTPTTTQSASITTNPILPATSSRTDAPTTTTPTDASHLGKYIALDCEMVGTHSLTPFSIRSRNDAADFSLLARVSLVSYTLEPIYDAYVLPPAGVVVSDYRTRWSGITPAHLDPARAHSTDPAVRALAARPFAQAQREVAALLEGRVLVGHALSNDLAVLGLSHPRAALRDTARHAAFRARLAPVDRDGNVVGKLKAPSLKRLTKEVLGWEIQADERAGHSSVEDARAAMALYKYDKAAFEREATGKGARGADRAGKAWDRKKTGR